MPAIIFCISVYEIHAQTRKTTAKFGSDSSEYDHKPVRGLAQSISIELLTSPAKIMCLRKGIFDRDMCENL